MRMRVIISPENGTTQKYGVEKVEIRECFKAFINDLSTVSN
jgi:hypothetical protein